MRIALVGPFSGATLASAFSFPEGGAPLPPGYPGAPLMTTLAKALVERGHEVAAISTCYTTPVAELEPFRHWAARGIDVYFCPQRPRSFRGTDGRRGRAVDFFRFERDSLRAAIDHFAPEFIHAHWTYEFVWAALDSGVPMLATAHDSPGKVLRYMPNLYRLVRYLMARRVIGRCMHLTAVSPDLERDIRAWAPAPITVVANPIARQILDAPGCVPQAFQSRTLVMVLNGWVDLKNGATALQAFQLARRIDPGLKLVCFGADFQVGGPAQQWAESKGLTEGVEFRGPTPHHAILEQLRASMALLHPSRLEACSMSIGEAMSVGLPAIAGRRTGGVSWQLDEGRAGVLVEIDDAKAMADAVVALGRDPARWLDLSAAARLRARQLFALDALVDRYCSLYRQVSQEAQSTRAPALAS
jgi:L-malate glycosyltransferase